LIRKFYIESQNSEFVFREKMCRVAHLFQIYLCIPAESDVLAFAAVDETLSWWLEMNYYA
jgi:hypothetical protein